MLQFNMEVHVECAQYAIEVDNPGYTQEGHAWASFSTTIHNAFLLCIQHIHV